MPHAQAYFSALGDAQAYQWQTLRAADLKNVDVLAVRSTTKVDKALLGQADRLKYVATATAGTNHMDIPFLQEKGIKWYGAGGCNADAVAQYVTSALLYAGSNSNLDLATCKIGIVGAGNVGSAVAKTLRALSIDYCLFDPPISAHDEREFTSFDTILGCDVICLHVPFTRNTKYPTENMFSYKELQKLNQKQWLINACRGEVVDEEALLELKQQGLGPQLILDVWQNEPNIDLTLLPHVRLATPHIAGHTDEGKIRGTQMVYDWLLKQGCAHHSTKPQLTLQHFLQELEPISYGFDKSDMSIGAFLQRIYDIQFDHRIFVENMAKSNAFSALRKQYKGRREYSAYPLSSTQLLDAKTRKSLTELGFTLLD